MKNSINRLDFWALLSLAIFLVLNLIMWSGGSNVDLVSIVRSCSIAALLYVVPILLAHWGVKIAYHVLGFIMIIYTFSFAVTLSFFFNPVLSTLLKWIITPLAILGLLVNLVWYRLLFKNLRSHLLDRYERKNK